MEPGRFQFFETESESKNRSVLVISKTPRLYN
jgi:hypothetical protein